MLDVRVIFAKNLPKMATIKWQKQDGAKTWKSESNHVSASKGKGHKTLVFFTVLRVRDARCTINCPVCYK